MESKSHVLTKVGRGILKMRLLVAYRCALKKKEDEVKVILEDDFIKQPFLQLYGKLTGKTTGIKTTHADQKKKPRDFEKEMCCCVSACIKKEKHEVKVILEEDFIKQPFLKLSSKLKGNTNGIKTPHADDSVPRDFEKEMFCCVSMCLKKEK